MELSLVVLAAGIGSRYGSLKQVEKIGPSGETIIDYSIYDALRAGFNKIVFVINKNLHADFQEIFGEKLSDDVAVEYAFQEITNLPPGFTCPPDRTKPWGTTHAVLAAAPYINGPFAVINADDFYGADSYKIIAEFLRTLKTTDNRHCIVGYELENTLSEFGGVSRGVCQQDVNGKIIKITEHFEIQKNGTTFIHKNEKGEWADIPGATSVSMNLLGFSHTIFQHLEREFINFLDEHLHEPKAEFYIPWILNYLLENKLADVNILPSKEKWFGITFREDKDIVIAQISKLVKDGIYPEKLWY